MVFCFFLGQVVNGARLPVENRDVDGGSCFRLVVDCEAGTIGRPDGSCLGNIGSESEVGNFAAVAGNRVKIVNFAAALVRFEDDPFAVGRPYRIRLAIVRLAELNWPTAGGIDLPEVVAAGDVGREGDLMAVGRPGWADDPAREEEIIDRDGAGAEFTLRGERLRVGDFACVGRIGSENGKSDKHQQAECEAAYFHRQPPKIAPERIFRPEDRHRHRDSNTARPTVSGAA